MSPTILVDSHETWVEITLNRPDRLNSFNEDMHRALRAALDQARRDKMRAILLSGAGRGFCAGQDLNDRNPSATGKPPDLGEDGPHVVFAAHSPHPRASPSRWSAP